MPKYYDATQGGAKNDEKRKVEFVKWDLNEERRSCRAKRTGLRRYRNGDRATDFSSVLDKGARISNTRQRIFNCQCTSGGIHAAEADPPMKRGQPLVAAAFSIDTGAATGDGGQVTDGFTS